MKPSAIKRLGLTYERAATVQRAHRVRRVDGVRAQRRRRSGVRLRHPGGDGGGRHDRSIPTIRRPCRAIRRSTTPPGSTAALGPAGADRLGARRTGRRLAARRDAVPAELSRVGLPERRCRAEALSVSGRIRITFRRSCSRRPTDTWRCSSPTTPSGSRSPPRPGSRASPRWPNGRRSRDEVLAVVAAAARHGHRTRAGRRGCVPLGIPAAAVRTLPEALEATPRSSVTAGDFKLVRSPIHIDGYDPEYRPPPPSRRARRGRRRLSRRSLKPSPNRYLEWPGR